MSRTPPPRALSRPALAAAAALALAAASAPAQDAPAGAPAAGAPRPAAPPLTPAERCGLALDSLRRNPTAAELRCLYGAHGPGRFGLLSYLDVPVYQPHNPLPGTHVVGVAGMPGPRPGESFEAWEWRVLTHEFGPGVRTAYRGLEGLDPVVAARVLRFEQALRVAGIRAHRRETWRSPERQAWIFQQGRSRPGPVATTTLTSWHSRVDALGRAAGRAADYDVAPAHLARFHQIARECGLDGYGADSNDPGHVYYVGPDWLAARELAVLRLLPRVPHVTLETGRPADEVHTRDTLARLRELSRIFAAGPAPRLPRTRAEPHPIPPAHVAPPR